MRRNLWRKRFRSGDILVTLEPDLPPFNLTPSMDYFR